jgi:hypothetical protein
MFERRRLPEPVDQVARFAAAVGCAALAPRRLWARWNGPLPMGAASTVAALSTFLAAFAVGIPGFLRYAAQAGSAVSDAMLLTGHAVNTGHAPLAAMPGSHAVSLFSLFAFVFLTPLGWLSLYLCLTGLYRAVGAAVGEPLGDPLAGLVDGLLLRRRERRAAEEAAASRAAQEGAEVPDVLLDGRAGGAPEAAFVVVASRVKPGWDEGAFVMAPEAWFRLGRPFDQRYPDGLRRVYPLIVPGAAEVIRRRVSYELPALSDRYPASTGAGPGPA